MIKFGCKVTLLCGVGEEGSRLGKRSKSIHLLRGTASFRPLGTTGHDLVNASQENQAGDGYPYLTLA